MTVKSMMIVNFLIIAIVAIGWVKNIVKLADCDFQQPYKAEVIHAVGIIPPVGMITGWIDVGK